MVTVTMEAEKETAVLKGKTALGLTIADGKGGLILNATWEGEHLEIQDLQIKEGLIDIRVLVKKKAQKRLNAMVYTIQRGYETLSKSYPEFVHMNAKSGVVEKKK